MTHFTEHLERFAEKIGGDRVQTDASILDSYAVDGMKPGAVIFPRNAREVSEVVKMANRENLSLVPRGSGTKIGMGHAPARLDLVVSSSRMDHMLDVDTANLTITVEAGVKFRDIQARLATEDDRCYLPLEDLDTPQDELICSDRSNSGCFLPMDPPFSETATIGGIVAANSSGPRRLLYRFPRDLLLGVRFVAPSGHIIGTGGKTVKNVSGYDISKLMAGSFGSLGFICDMTFKLLPLPEKMETVFFSFEGFEEACGLADAILDSPLLPAAVEIMNQSACENLPCGEKGEFTPGPYGVAVAMETFEPAVVRIGEETGKMANGFGALGSVVFSEDDHRRFWLSVSHLQTSAGQRLRDPVTIHLTYPISQTEAVVGPAEAFLHEKRIEHTLLVHAGTGACIMTLAGEGKGVVQAIHDLSDRCREKGGNRVVQQAPPELKADLKMWGEPGPDRIVMQRIKSRLDPAGIFSPGRFAGGL